MSQLTGKRTKMLTRHQEITLSGNGEGWGFFSLFFFPQNHNLHGFSYPLRFLSSPGQVEIKYFARMLYDENEGHVGMPCRTEDQTSYTE